VEHYRQRGREIPAHHRSGPEHGEGIVAALAREIFNLNEELAALDALISEKVTEHTGSTQVLLSMPGFGPVLAAEFLGATGGDLTVFETADRFAGVAGLAPAPAPGTPAKSPATITAPGAMTAGSCGFSTSPASRR